ncbi:MAG: hypothetical protein V4607_02160 [Pseudomonadota bacterium]
MTDFAALAAEAVSFMETNNAAVEAHSGAAFPESKILRAMSGADSTGGRSVLGYAYQCELLRGAPSVTNRAEAYKLTHTIFFATDFGNKTISGIAMSAYCSLLDSLVITYAEDLDVLGELLISAKCIGHWSSAMDSALELFTDGWLEIDREDFGGNYHPVLVGGILFSMLVE